MWIRVGKMMVNLTPRTPGNWRENPVLFVGAQFCLVGGFNPSEKY
jgi:hypothetical protein